MGKDPDLDKSKLHDRPLSPRQQVLKVFSVKRRADTTSLSLEGREKLACLP